MSRVLLYEAVDIMASRIAAAEGRAAAAGAPARPAQGPQGEPPSSNTILDTITLMVVALIIVTR